MNNERIQEIKTRNENQEMVQEYSDIAYLLSEVERLQKSLEWANRIIGSGIDMGAQLRYDPMAWLIEYHSHLKGE